MVFGVTAKILKKVTKAVKKSGFGNAKDNSIAVTTYVIKSATNAVKNIAISSFTFNFLSPNQTAYPHKGPIIPMDNTFAPRVVIPPCANITAWNTNTITDKTPTTAGPKNTAPNPLPHGCEQLPVTDGIFNDDNINMKADR